MSTSRKFANLPDIDDAPDVYETPDVPSEMSHNWDAESDDLRPLSPAKRGEKSGLTPENIDNEHLDTTNARNRFRNSELAQDDTLYAIQIRKRANKQRDGDAEPETIAERLRRLRFEITELQEEALKDPEENDDKKQVSPIVLLRQLQMMRSDLNGVEKHFPEKIIEQPSTPNQSLTTKAKASAGILSKLGWGKDQSQTPEPHETAGNSSPQKIDLGALEKRLAMVERTIGATQADIDENKAFPTTLLTSLSRLDHLLTLLTQPRHLDSISRRIKVLVSDLERLHESRRKLGDTRPLSVAIGSGMTVSVPGTDTPDQRLKTPVASTPSNEAIGPDMQQKIDSLFALLPRLDPLLPLTPRLLARLQSLSSLHTSASAFQETLDGLKSQIIGLEETEVGLKEALEGVEMSMKENEAKVRGNLEGLDTRLDALVRRVDALKAD